VLISNKQKLFDKSQFNDWLLYICNLIKKHNKLRLFIKQKLLISFQKKTQQVEAFYKSTQFPQKKHNKSCVF